MNTPFFVMEIIGTVAFAASGAHVAIDQKMDIFGVAILGLTTAVGGGIIRDLILGVTPPETFTDPVYALVAIAVSVILFFSFVRRGILKKAHAFDLLMLWMDTIGLAIFTVIGVRAGLTRAEGNNIFLAVFVGVVTGVGGGVMRDLFAGQKPGIFVKHFYATASLIGALLTALLWSPCGEPVSMLAGGIAVVVLRILAAVFKWNLPRPKADT